MVFAGMEVAVDVYSAVASRSCKGIGSRFGAMTVVVESQLRF